MARLLLDTHTVLWWLTDPDELHRDAFQSIECQQNEVFVSSVSGWEIAVKRALGKLKAPDNLEAAVKAQDFIPLNLTFLHAEQAGALPPHHGDPFDRMLIAQAQVEGLILVTRDIRIPRYGIRTMSA
ncbi:MAG: type II toxin-antitoxin system VapC family toxin [Acidobacteriota bacterium]|nr:type II toxin-antitoxin system VapC family toxin [Acidobacteriota bacterium]